MRKWCCLLILTFLLSGCGMQTQESERLKDLDFTVMDLEKVPEELRNVLEEKKSKTFKVTYEDEGRVSLYLCRLRRAGHQRIQYCGRGSVSDGQCNLCGYGTAGAWKRRDDHCGGNVSLYCVEAGISG